MKTFRDKKFCTLEEAWEGSLGIRILPEARMLDASIKHPEPVARFGRSRHPFGLLAASWPLLVGSYFGGAGTKLLASVDGPGPEVEHFPAYLGVGLPSWVFTKSTKNHYLPLTSNLSFHCPLYHFQGKGSAFVQGRTLPTLRPKQSGWFAKHGGFIPNHTVSLGLSDRLGRLCLRGTLQGSCLMAEKQPWIGSWGGNAHLRLGFIGATLEGQRAFRSKGSGASQRLSDHWGGGLQCLLGRALLLGWKATYYPDPEVQFMTRTSKEATPSFTQPISSEIEAIIRCGSWISINFQLGLEGIEKKEFLKKGKENFYLMVGLQCHLFNGAPQGFLPWNHLLMLQENPFLSWGAKEQKIQNAPPTKQQALASLAPPPFVPLRLDKAKIAFPPEKASGAMEAAPPSEPLSPELLQARKLFLPLSFANALEGAPAPLNLIRPFNQGRLQMQDETDPHRNFFSKVHALLAQCLHLLDNRLDPYDPWRLTHAPSGRTESLLLSNLYLEVGGGSSALTETELESNASLILFTEIVSEPTEQSEGAASEGSLALADWLQTLETEEAATSSTASPAFPFQEECQEAGGTLQSLQSGEDASIMMEESFAFQNEAEIYTPSFSDLPSLPALAIECLPGETIDLSEKKGKSPIGYAVFRYDRKDFAKPIRLLLCLCKELSPLSSPIEKAFSPPWYELEYYGDEKFCLFLYTPSPAFDPQSYLEAEYLLCRDDDRETYQPFYLTPFCPRGGNAEISLELPDQTPKRPVNWALMGYPRSYKLTPLEKEKAPSLYSNPFGEPSYLSWPKIYLKGCLDPEHHGGFLPKNLEGYDVTLCQLSMEPLAYFYLAHPHAISSTGKADFFINLKGMTEPALENLLERLKAEIAQDYMLDLLHPGGSKTLSLIEMEPLAEALDSYRRAGITLVDRATFFDREPGAEDSNNLFGLSQTSSRASYWLVNLETMEVRRLQEPYNESLQLLPIFVLPVQRPIEERGLALSSSLKQGTERIPCGNAFSFPAALPLPPIGNETSRKNRNKDDQPCSPHAPMQTIQEHFPSILGREAPQRPEASSALEGTLSSTHSKTTEKLSVTESQVSAKDASGQETQGSLQNQPELFFINSGISYSSLEEGNLSGPGLSFLCPASSTHFIPHQGASSSPSEGSLYSPPESDLPQGKNPSSPSPIEENPSDFEENPSHRSAVEAAAKEPRRKLLSSTYAGTSAAELSLLRESDLLSEPGTRQPLKIASQSFRTTLNYSHSEAPRSQNLPYTAVEPQKRPKKKPQRSGTASTILFTEHSEGEESPL